MPYDVKKGWAYGEVMEKILAETATLNMGEFPTTLGQLVQGFNGVEELVGQDKTYVLTPTGLQTLCERIDFPVGALKKLPQHLQVEAVRALAVGNEESPVVVQTTGDRVDSVHSGEYRPIRNAPLALLMSNLIPKNARVYRWDLSHGGRTLDMRILSADWEVNLGNGRPDPGYGGVHIINDELGGSSFRMVMCVARVLCLNYTLSTHELMSQQHRWFNPQELSDSIRTGIAKVPQFAEEVAAELRGYHKIPVADPILTLDRMGEINGVPQYALAEAKTFWQQNGAEHNWFAVDQAMKHGTKFLTDDLAPRRHANWDERNRLEQAMWDVGQQVREHDGVEQFFNCPVCHRPVETQDEAV